MVMEWSTLYSSIHQYIGSRGYPMIPLYISLQSTHGAKGLCHVAIWGAIMEGIERGTETPGYPLDLGYR